ncbi:MAG: DUF4340 domain-containing protein [Burkholderiales bacterium]
MNRNQFIVLVGVLVALIVAGAGVMWLQRSDWRSSNAKVGEKLIPGLIVSEVVKMRVVESTDAVTAVKVDGKWQVVERDGYPAHIDRIAEFLAKLAELKVTQLEPLAESQRARLQLVEPKGPQTKDAGVLIELEGAAGKSLGRLLLGKRVVMQAQTTAPSKGSPQPTGRYVISGSDASNMAVILDPLPNAEAKPGLWLSRDLIRVSGAKAMQWTSGGGKPGWSVVRESETKDWRFADSGEKLDNNKVQDLVSVVLYIALGDVVTDKTKGNFDKGATLKIQSFDGLGYTIRLGDLEGENRYIKVAINGEPPKVRVPGKDETAEEKEKLEKTFEENRKAHMLGLERERKLEPWTFLVPNSNVEALARDRTQILPSAKKDDAKK